MPQTALKLYPPPGGELAPEEIYATLELPGGKPYTAINMVSTADGRAAIGGRAGRIGSATDRGNMNRIRAAADAVMSGAGTLRKEGVNFELPDELVRLRRRRGLPGQPLAVILTGSGELPAGRSVFRRSRESVVVMVPETLPEKKEAEISRFATVRRAGGDRFPDLRRALEILHGEFGVRRLLSEGGPSVNHALLRAGLADELFLTLAPKLSGNAAGPGIVSGEELNPEARQNLRLETLYAHGSELYLRYRILK
ncbi:RibD family protein [Rubrobacter taiwanensis]|uniref:RibD family protein n=1 Tax=Rubrobacter taiwanensis TaxID=185139 RepID=A0A4R1BQG2_9ACTN|nr:RibD family protein [Rubrobacter taiwanensis]TCJ19831.1 RibD family protein [Rubrobacter taiwanensis]